MAKLRVRLYKNKVRAARNRTATAVVIAKRHTALTVGQAKTVRKIAKAACNASMETKARYVQMPEQHLGGNNILCINPLYHIPVDTTQSGRIGDNIQNVYMKARGVYKHVGISRQALGVESYPWGRSWLRIVAFSVPKQFRNTVEATYADLQSGWQGTGTTTSVGDLFRGVYNSRYPWTFYNTDVIKVLMDKTVSCSFTSPHANNNTVNNFMPSLQAGATRFNFSLNLGKKVDYVNSSAPSYHKGREIYIAFIAGTPSPEPAGANLADPTTANQDIIGQVSMDYLLTYKDA